MWHGGVLRVRVHVAHASLLKCMFRSLFTVCVQEYVIGHVCSACVCVCTAQYTHPELTVPEET